MAYSMDLRKRVLRDCDSGIPTKRVAEKYSVSRAWVRRLKQHRRERGHIRPLKTGPHEPWCIDRQRLISLVEQQPDATLAELRDRLGVACSLSAIWTALQHLQLTLKKK
jgi:transposase